VSGSVNEADQFNQWASQTDTTAPAAKDPTPADTIGDDYSSYNYRDYINQ
jgi:hypothetical protein